MLLYSGSPALTSVPSYMVHEAYQALVIVPQKKPISDGRDAAGGANALQQHSWEGVLNPMQVPRVFSIAGHCSHRLERYRDIARIPPAREWCLTGDDALFLGPAV